MKNLLLSFSLILLNACTNLPPEIKDAPLFDIAYSQAKQNIDKFNDAPVRWGGIIVEVENEQSSSLVQILYYPLSYYGRPQTSQTAEGRFVIKSPDFLDPAVYAKGTEITIAGTLKGDIERTIGKKTIRLPLILASAIHLWPKYENNNYYNGYGGYGGFGYPYYGYYRNPYYWGGYYRPYPW